MTDKELRRSSKKDLIEMLYYLRKELDDARAENERLNKRFDLLLSEATPGKNTESDDPAGSDADTGEALQAGSEDPDGDGKS